MYTQSDNETDSWITMGQLKSTLMYKIENQWWDLQIADLLHPVWPYLRYSGNKNKWNSSSTFAYYL